MIRVVLDTNVVVSAYLNQQGVPFFILKMALSGAIQLCVSKAILDEYEELLGRKSYALDQRRTRVLLKHIRTASELFRTAGGLDVTTDPDDNMFLECAQAAKAQYLITGNTAHFPKQRWKYTGIVTPRAFINIWKDLRPGEDLP